MEITVRCGCGRTMAPDHRAGPQSYRCGCRATVRLAGLPDDDPRRCPIRIGQRICRGPKPPEAAVCQPCTVRLADQAMTDPDVVEQLAENRGALDFFGIRKQRTDRMLEEWAAQTRIDRRPDAPRCGVVYYAELRPGIVKIGTTLNLAARMSSLHVPPASVIAAEPGTYDVEKARHRQFAHLRIGQREDFRVDNDLHAHVEGIAAEHGNPYELAARLTEQARTLASRPAQS